jgi:hypothetical protein
LKAQGTVKHPTSPKEKFIYICDSILKPELKYNTWNHLIFGQGKWNNSLIYTNELPKGYLPINTSKLNNKSS